MMTKQTQVLTLVGALAGAIAFVAFLMLMVVGGYQSRPRPSLQSCWRPSSR